MIYKKHELSLSLNGADLVHIARNASGNVVFRESSEKALKRAIDDVIKEQEYQDQLIEQKRLEREKKKSQRDSADAHLTGSHEVTEPTSLGKEEEVEEANEETLIPSPKSVTRGPDGKFISKSQLDTDEDLKKKTFWDKLTS